MIRSRRALAAAIFAVALLGAACSDDGGQAGGTTATWVPPTSIGPFPEPTTTSTPVTTTELLGEPRGEVLDEVRTTTTPDGRERTWRVHLPASLPSSGPVPVVVALHGGTGWADQFIAGAHWLEVAEEGAFALVAPDGVGTAPRQLQTWNGGDGYCCGPAMNQGVDDVSFIVGIVEELSEEIDVDPGRVFAVGHSNGGIMSYRLACEAAGTFAAVGVVAGSLGVEGCDPAQPVSVIHLHGEADENHPFEGGIGPKSIQPNPFNPVMGGIDTWVELDACEPMPVTLQRGKVTTATWAGCEDGVEVELVRIADAPHAWPGGTVLAPALQGEPSQAIDASRAIWAFLAEHGR